MRVADSGLGLRVQARQLLRTVPGGALISRSFRDPSLRSVVFVFVLSRALVLAIFILTSLLRTTPDPNYPGHVDASISIQKVQIARILRQEVLTADANWYVGIAENGYEHRAFDAATPHNWAFFPLFPLLLRLAHYLTGEFALTGMALSHIFFFCALLFFYKTSESFGLKPDAAYRSISYLAFYPVGYFFSAPLTESLFLMLTTASFLSAKREKWWLAGVTGALASATRFSGLLLLPALAILFFQSYKSSHRRVRSDAGWLLLIPVGLISFMVYLYATTGNAFAFTASQAAWGRRFGFFLTPLYLYLLNPAEIGSNWDFRLLNFAASVTVLACGAILIKRREFALAAYTLLSVLLTLSTTLLQSQARYAMVVFPVYMVLALGGRNKYFDQLTRSLFLVLFALLTAMFAAHFILALS